MIKTYIDSSAVKKALHSAGGFLPKYMADAMDRIGRSFYKTFNSRNLAGRPYINSRSGGIRKRFKYNVLRGVSSSENPHSTVGVKIFAKSRIAWRHEHGETLTGPDGRRIAVPLQARGSRLFLNSGRIRSKYRTESKTDRVIPMRFRGQWYLAEVSKSKKAANRVTPLFILKEHVVIPARLGFHTTFNELLPKFLRYLDEGAARAVREAVRA